MYYANFEIKNKIYIKAQERHVINATLTRHYKRFFFFKVTEKLKIWRYEDETVWRLYGDKLIELPHATLNALERDYRAKMEKRQARFKRFISNMDRIIEEDRRTHQNARHSYSRKHRSSHHDDSSNVIAAAAFFGGVASDSSSSSSGGGGGCGGGGMD